jgi:hypothetical protein
MFIRDTIYRQEFLNILDIEYGDDDDANDEQINSALKELSIQIKDSTELTKCMVKVSKKHMNIGKYMTNNEELGLMLLFSYDYMYLTHICVSEFIETGKISDKNIKNLEKAI